ncbi:hydroxyacid-oxoacid transhydrogenase [Janibacter corallicola]|uniref:hydroxyacid-oxoacid transhydrogenase n=1 Tax=Janibacter corallicola TaxID=415212 RepID=UPI00082ACEA2|nr:hydroxyacid-oxoacid transhydrogenase [Janibacter corallicola]
MTIPTPNTPESVFTYAAPRLKFGPGSIEEIGHDVAGLGARSVLVVTDPVLAATGHPERVAEALRAAGLQAEVHDSAHVEPTDTSLTAAVERARSGARPDVVVAVGGGSSMDTAKAVSLLLSNPGELMDYVNAPVGGGRAPEQPVLPMVAVPTTTGTGAESTTVCVLDVLAAKVKTGISHERLRPVLAVIDPDLTATQPAGVTASAGMDILCHALESWTARPYTSHEHKQAHERVPYCGANPIADMFAERAMRLLAGAFRPAVAGDDAARTDMALAATFAGMGFGNAGVHLPHAGAYPIAGRVHDLDTDFRPDGYGQDHPMVPHGMSVAATAPAVFALTFEADPERHLAAASWLDPQGLDADVPGPERLPAVLRRLMRDIGQPSGLAEIGYGEADVDALVAGTMQQQRLLASVPRPVTEEDVAAVMRASMHHW